MRIVHLAAGAGGMYCGACARDITMVRGLISLGHDVLVMPLYTPLRDERHGDLPTTRVYLGGISAYLQQVSALFRHTPAALDRLLDHPALLRLATHFAVSTRAEDLGAMTASVLSGLEGRQRKDLVALLDELASQRKPDLVSITNSLLSAAAPEIKRRVGCPVVCGVQGEDAFVDAMGDPWRDRVRELVRRNARAVDLFVAPGDAYAAAMCEWLDVPPSRMRVVRPGIDVDAYGGGDPRPQPARFTVGYLSVITPAKGLDALVEAFVRAADRLPAARLMVAGKVLRPGYWRGIHRRIAEAGLAGRFEHLGEVSFERKVAFLRECSAVCVPTRVAESRGMVALEAMAAGAPVVAPGSGVFPEVLALTGGGLLFEPGSPDSLAEQLAWLHDRPERAEEMGIAGAEGAQRHFAAPRLATEMAGVFATACAAAPPIGVA